MRSKDPTADQGATTAQRFGALVTELAQKAGYDTTSGTGGRAALARDIGSMSPSAVARMLDGKTLPMPHQLEAIARVVKTDVRTLLVNAGVISRQSWPDSANTDVLSATSQGQSMTPEEVADMWHISDPGIRSMLVSAAHQAIRLQAEADGRTAGGGTTRKR